MLNHMDRRALLKTLLQELKDGVIVCDPEAKIILFNPAAEDLLSRHQSLSPGKSLYDLCFRPPVEHALNLLAFQLDTKSRSKPLPVVQFVNTSLSQERFFRCRISFLPPLNAAKKSFIIIFEDISAWYSPDNPLFMKIEEFRAPMTNLRAAVENLTEYPEMSPVMRSAFENVLVQESLNLTGAFDSLARSCNVLLQTQNHLTELNTEVLFGYVAHHLRTRKIAVTASPKRSITVKVDIYGLLLLLDYMVGRINKILQKKKKTGLTCEAHIADNFIYFDLIWPGKYLASGAVQAMQEEKLEQSLGGMTVSSILRAMEGDIWSQQHDNSQSVFRLVLPASTKAGQ
jgi:DNA polymerase-3 subunit epsilon